MTARERIARALRHQNMNHYAYLIKPWDMLDECEQHVYLCMADAARDAATPDVCHLCHIDGNCSTTPENVASGDKDCETLNCPIMELRA